MNNNVFLFYFKRKIYKVAFFIIAFVIAGLYGCKKTTEQTISFNPAPPSTVKDLIYSDANYTLLKVAFKRTNLLDDLPQGNLTLFAPTNAAFIEANYKNEEAINAIPLKPLTDLLKNHIIQNASIKNSQFKTGLSSFPSINDSLQMYNLNKGPNAGLYLFGTIKLDDKDILESDGVVHPINKIIRIPHTNLAGIINASPDLSLLAYALKRTKLLSGFTGNTPYTIFAPSNSAFIAMGIENKKDIDKIKKNTLETALKLYILTGRIYSIDLIGAGSYKLSNNRLLKVFNSNNSIAVNYGSNNLSTLIKKDILAKNGVIHVIDKLFTPVVL